MQIYTVSFFGHRMPTDPLGTEQKLYPLVLDILKNHEYVEFLVGRDGEFDQIVSSAIHRCKQSYRADNSSHIWVLPYVTADFQKYEEDYRCYYDDIEISESAGVHYKAAFQARNRGMVDRSDLVVVCVEHKSGGAYQTMRYAVKSGKPVVNLAELEPSENTKDS